MNQYDKFAHEYEQWTKSPLRKFAWQETIEKNLTDIKGKRVLDIACGTGYSIEILYKLGAKEVIGIDLSSTEIEIAKKKFPETKFLVGDISKDTFEELGEFDVITAIFLFEYASTKENLKKMMVNIANRLKKGGLFCSLTINPYSIPIGKKYYGISGNHPNGEGAPFTDNLYNEEGIFLISADMFYWSTKTINKMCKEEGLIDFTSLPVYVSDVGIKKYGKNHWDEFYKNPIYVIFKARKST